MDKANVDENVLQVVNTKLILPWSIKIIGGLLLILASFGTWYIKGINSKMEIIVTKINAQDVINAETKKDFNSLFNITSENKERIGNLERVFALKPDEEIRPIPRRKS